MIIPITWIKCSILPWASQVALVFKSSPASAGDARDSGSIPGSGRSPEVGKRTLRQYSCLKNSMGRRAWRAAVHGIAKSQTGLSTWAHTVAFCLRSYVVGQRSSNYKCIFSDSYLWVILCIGCSCAFTESLVFESIHMFRCTGLLKWCSLWFCSFVAVVLGTKAEKHFKNLLLLPSLVTHILTVVKYKYIYIYFWVLEELNF